MKRRNEERASRTNKTKLSALEKLRHSKRTGEKYKHEITEDPSVFSYVDEETYENEISKQKNTSWLVGDDSVHEEEKYTPTKAPKVIAGTFQQNSTIDSSLSNLFIRRTKPINSSKVNTIYEIDEDILLKDILKSFEPENFDSSKSIQRQSFQPIIKPEPIELEEKQNMKTQQEEPTEQLKTENLKQSNIVSALKHNTDDLPNKDVQNISKNPHNDVLKNDSNEMPEQIKTSHNIINDFSAPSFDLSELSNECADIEAQIIDQSLNYSVGSEDISFNNSSINFNVISLMKHSGERKLLEFFLLDLCEARDSPNTVYLFGKVVHNNKHLSCMVHLRNVPNQFYILPRSQVQDQYGGSKSNKFTSADVYKEINSVLEKNGILKFECRPQQLLYPFFENETPHIHYDVLEVLCMGGQKLNLNSGTTFSHVFGLKRSLSEYLILYLKIKGPCWLNLIDPNISESKKSHCRFEICVDFPKNIHVNLELTEPPELIATSLSIITKSSASACQIIAASLVTTPISMNSKSQVSTKSITSTISIVCPPHGSCGVPIDFIKFSNSKNISVDITTTERSLITLLFTKIAKLDPDVIVGHDLFEYTLKFLSHSASLHKVSISSMLGRLKQSNISQNIKSHTNIPLYVGRLAVDLKSLAEELVKLSSYDLSELCKQILNIERSSMDWVDINRYFTQSGPLLGLVKHLMNDSFYCLRIMDELNILPLFKQISSICGHPINRSLVLGRAERIEYLLLHSYTENNCICPDKYLKSSKTLGNPNSSMIEEVKGNKRKAAYEGGLVIDPKAGFYPNIILLLDFMSLYPSLIQEFNICFTTMKFVKSDGDISAVPLDLQDNQGVLPREIRKLVDKRRQVKSLMQEAAPHSSEYLNYEIRQRALKLIANSIYGCLGYVNSRFYAKPLASLITMKGRELLERTKEIVQNLGFDVIYGDTDSIMVNTNHVDYSKVKESSQKIINAVNKNYKFLKIELDGIFHPMLLLKKKKYAAISVTINPDGSLTRKKELKGLDIVRHDWSIIAKETGELILDLILSQNNHEFLMEKAHEYLAELNSNLDSNQIDNSKFIIKKKLTKKLEEYVDIKSQTHLLVAQRLITEGKKLTVGDTIEYIICIDGTDKPYTQRGYHPSEVVNNSFNIDVKYYKECQILPIVSRLCNHIDGLESDVISRCLGVTVGHKSHPLVYKSIRENENVEPLIYECQNCGTDQTFELIRSNDDRIEFGLNCSSCATDINFKRVGNIVERSIFKHVKEYYKNYLICSEPMCTCDISYLSMSDYPSNYQCKCRKGRIKQKYPASQLFNQMEYIRNIFDLEALKSKYCSYPNVAQLLEKVNQCLRSETYLDDFNYINNKLKYIHDHNAFAFVDLSEIFLT